MAFDTATRNRLARMVSGARILLTEEFIGQLQEIYGIQPDGTIIEMEKLTHLDEEQLAIAAMLRDRVQHLTKNMAGEKKPLSAAIDRMTREQAFTLLNRFAALRMAEERKLIQESIAGGIQSKGFKVYLQVAGSGLGDTYARYRTYLFCLFDELAIDLGIIFDRYSSLGLLFPREDALLSLLALLNDQEIQPLWSEDETIGWIYQYFNSQEERKKMREASAAPRNSRELAVRNQFFTPRYVVEFLTDNTLGRIWYEMTQGETALKDQCRYLVRRPNEIFLAEGEEPPEQEEENENLSQEELLKQPVHIPFRKLKDPRQIRMLDPACGSMHFGLYAFDLFERIYEEAWEIEERFGALHFEREPDHAPLHECYADKKEFLADIPRLIIEHNIHGVDIDPRAVQIAGLSLWLRAQRTWQAQGIKQDARPRITRSNIVCAEPMPGDKEMLAEFTENLQPRVLGQLLEIVFDRMELAGEAGSLLKIEEEIADAVEEARQEFNKELQARKKEAGYLPGMAPEKRQTSLFDFTDLPDETGFWERAEEMIVQALEEYAAQAESESSNRRRLFARDAARGFAFIDICRKRYDVVLMNPPFGEPSTAGKGYIKRNYKDSSRDIFQSFVSRGIATISHGGRVGVLSARTGFFLGDSKHWRRNNVFSKWLVGFADLGLGVLDDALVEVAAYIIQNCEGGKYTTLASRQLSTREKDKALQRAIQNIARGTEPGFIKFDQSLITYIPDFTFCYWAPPEILTRYRESPPFGKVVSKVKQGVATADDFRFARLGWEVPAENIGRKKRWQRFSKGGEYSPPYDDIHLLVDWGINGEQLKAFSRCYIRNEKSYFKPGATYTVRTASAFSPKILPEQCIFSHNAQSWFCSSRARSLASIAYMICRIPQVYIELGVGGGDISTSGSAARRYTTAVIEGIPVEGLDTLESKQYLQLIEQIFKARIYEIKEIENSCDFSHLICHQAPKSLSEIAKSMVTGQLTAVNKALDASMEIDQAVTEAFHFPPSVMKFVDSELGIHPCSYSGEVDQTAVCDLFEAGDETIIARAIEKYGARRYFTKKSYFVNRRIELLSHYFQAPPSAIITALQNSQFQAEKTFVASSFLSQAIGIIFGRWNVVKPSKLTPRSPFQELQPCSPVTLTNNGGLPACQKDINPTYPITINWKGVIVSEKGHHEDVIFRIRKIIETVWKEKADDIEQEACRLLGESSLRDYFSLPNKFFSDHLKRYSKSRRKAPIYWPLATKSGSYTLWLYYHRLTDQTLFTCVNEFIKPKLDELAKEISALKEELEQESSTKKRRQLDKLLELVEELRDMREELLRVAALPYKPNLNDGVMITAAPLWQLFRHRQWSKDLKKCWDKLEKGDYDWAHLAYSIWPERVIPKCHKDRSLAIAHDLEEDFWEEIENGTDRQGNPKYKWAPRKLSKEDIQAIIREKTGK